MSNYTRKRDEQMNNRQKQCKNKNKGKNKNKNKKTKKKKNNVAMDLCEPCKTGTNEIPSTFLAAFKSPTFYS